MATTAAAPATYSQPSRKGKRAWRKNIDIEPVTSGLEEVREGYRQTGQIPEFEPSGSLAYRIDLTGDADIKKRVEKVQRKLKEDEILAARSKVPAVAVRNRADSSSKDGILKRKQNKEVSARDRARLWRVANSGGGNANHSVIERADVAAFDPWAASSHAPSEPNQSFLEEKKPVRKPDTLLRDPLALTASGKTIPSVPKPHAGRSYNPQFEDWSKLIEEQGEREVLAEQERQRLAAEERERDERTARTIVQAEREEQEQAAMSEHESEWEGFQSEPDEMQLTAKRPERKTPAERNRAKRQKAAARLEKHETKMRTREKQEKQLDTIMRDVESNWQSKVAAKNFDGFSSDEDLGYEDEDVELAKRPKFGKKFKPVSQDLEVVLPDELQDSLRLLRPEGNLLKDRYRTMVLQGKTEGRTPIPMQKKPRRKETEKWSYKDWSLDRS